MEQRQFRSWQEWATDPVVLSSDERTDILAWLETPFKETMKEWDEEAYRDYRAVRRKMRKEKRRK